VSILHFILKDDDDGFDNSFVHVMNRQAIVVVLAIKRLTKNFPAFHERVKGLLPSKASALCLLDGICVERIPKPYLVRLSSLSLIRKDVLSLPKL
jgi:hypothetical protein